MLIMTVIVDGNILKMIIIPKKNIAIIKLYFLNIVSK